MEILPLICTASAAWEATEVETPSKSPITGHLTLVLAKTTGETPVIRAKVDILRKIAGEIGVTDKQFSHMDRASESSLHL